MKKVVGIIIVILIILGLSRTLFKNHTVSDTQPVQVATTPAPEPTSERAQKSSAPTTTLSDKEIAAVIKERISDLNKCYGKYVRKNPDARGRIQTTLTINPNGSVNQARVLSSPDKDLEKCIVQILKSLHFKEFNGEAININYPMNFN